MARKNRYRNVLWVLFLGLTLGMSVEALAASDAWAIEDASARARCPICKSFLQPMQRLRLKTQDTSLTPTGTDHTATMAPHAFPP